MFLTKKYLSRRTMLRGVGAAVALPFLDSMVPAQTPIRKTAATPRPRLACLEMVHGMAGSTLDGSEKHYWSPAKTGRDFEMTPTLQALEPYREYLTIVSDTDLYPATAWSPDEEGGDHNRSSAVYLTAAHPKLTEGADISCGISLDQLYAQRAGQDTPLPSIQLCVDNGDGTGACGYGYACVYKDTVSWAAASSPLPMELNPRSAFERLFGDGGSQKERIARRRADRSILDLISHDVQRLQKDLDTKDRGRLNDYLSDVREIERRLEQIEKYSAENPDRQLPEAPLGVPDSWEEHVKLMFDLQALAFMAEVTRISAFKMSIDVSQRVFPGSGVKTPFHSISHHGENPVALAEFAKLNAYHVSMLPYFLEKLKNAPDGDGNLLDHSMVMYGSPMGDGNVHNHKRVPVILLGKANGQLSGNLHIREKDGTPMANILLAMLHKLGIEEQRFGDSNGTVAI